MSIRTECFSLQIIVYSESKKISSIYACLMHVGDSLHFMKAERIRSSYVLEHSYRFLAKSVTSFCIIS
jgi:hypothetical protein